MGALDAVGKRYFSDNFRFADAFNYLIYDGEPVIKADELAELDATQIAVPFGNEASLPMQKYRDLLKVWEAKRDANMIYVILGGEMQGSIHYGMPVKDGLYDMIGYSKQIEEARRSYRRKGKRDDGRPVGNPQEGEGNLVIENGTLRVKLTNDEFLSGFRKEDRLVPIVTAVIYVGASPWDGSMSLHEMMEFRDERIRRFVPDYRINLISPADMGEAEIEKFRSDLGFSMDVLKHQNEDADKIIESVGHKNINGDTARFLNVAANMGFKIDEKEGEIDMCLAMERRSQKDQITGAINGMRAMGASDSDIIEKVIELYSVTREYVLALLAPQTA
ncbi:MAG: hypothetical protein IJ679_13045 [Lachnospiraceae bacterium]|nr:hypothetical protein [Lachnospiraceae bacterium]